MSGAEAMAGRGDDRTAPAALPPALLQQAAGLFGMLAATTRLHIVWLLTHGERDVSSLAEEVGGTVAAVSQHLAKLKLAGLVRARREGRHQYYVVDDQHVASIVRQMVAHLRGEAADGGGRATGTGRARGVGA
ncbi:MULTISPECIES: ArsR/SmtB family transcription factor [Actinomadura]|uniref:ArsR/SmtB family transcription factor n=1 Tax=Actinomadura TaxID=1988 RepID=UPI0031EAC35D